MDENQIRERAADIARHLLLEAADDLEYLPLLGRVSDEDDAAIREQIRDIGRAVYRNG